MRSAAGSRQHSVYIEIGAQRVESVYKLIARLVCANMDADEDVVMP